MVVSLGGAMSTAELGVSLSEMIRRGMVHALSCTGANLEEDVFGLVGRRDYVSVRGWRSLSPTQEQDLHERGLSRVTDTCIPNHVITTIERELVAAWKAAEASPGERLFPHEYIYRMLLSESLSKHYQIDPSESWVLAAAKANLPLVVPGWEDSTLGNAFASRLLNGELHDATLIKGGIEYMLEFAQWYSGHAKPLTMPGAGHGRTVGSVGFFQVGGGIAGDFPLCVVPMLRDGIPRHDLPVWGYFCQVSDAPMSYGGYSGAGASEKITWGKLSPDTPAFVIESDATIVVPLIFASVLGW